jgi:hypothetical protein
VTEFIVHVVDKPGVLAAITQQLAEAGVHIEALAALGSGEDAQIRILPDDADAVRRVLRADGLRFEEREVITTTLPHRAQAMASFARRLADGGVNIEALYLLRSSTEGQEFAFAVDPLTTARSIAES